MTDEKIFADFVEAAEKMMAAGLKFARKDDPLLYGEVCRAVEERRAVPVLTVTFKPASVGLYLSGELNGSIQRVQVFQYRANLPGEVN